MFSILTIFSVGSRLPGRTKPILTDFFRVWGSRDAAAMRDAIRIAHHHIVSCSDAMGLRFGLSAVWPVMRAAAMPNR